MNTETTNIKILINNFSIKYKKYENNFTKDNMLFFKNVNDLVYAVIDYCIKENIVYIKSVYDSYSDFACMFKEELIHYLFSIIDINDQIYTKNLKLFTVNGDDECSYYKDYEINMNDYGTVNTNVTYQSYNSQSSTKFKQECDKISLYIYVSNKQNKFDDFLKKLEDIVKDYSQQDYNVNK